MPSFAKVIPFPSRISRTTELSPEECGSVAADYLGASERTVDLRERSLANPDVLLVLMESLRDLLSASPSHAASEASEVYDFLCARDQRIGVFDEQDYFVGSAALIAGGGFRLAGKCDEAEVWFDRADIAFRGTINPGPSLASVGYARLTLQYDRRSHDRVLAQAPALARTFSQFGMKREELKTRFLEVLSQKELGRLDDALHGLQSLESDPDLWSERQLAPIVASTTAELLYRTGRHADAAACCSRALSMAGDQNPLAVAHLKAVNATVLREQGYLTEAVQAFRAAVGDYSSAGVPQPIAYLRVLLAEALVALKRYREAEWEILAALPTIEEQKMVPEGFAAVALLKESVRRRKTDPNALRELREHLQANQ
jgi:tetratricopeptide (TPR) repeat protein